MFYLIMMNMEMSGNNTYKILTLKMKK